MGRNKAKRSLNFRPLFKSFVPKDKEFNGNIILLHEEIEAIYSMDILNLYQEDAAKRMEISRPTFTRILKSAREKITNAIISGSELTLKNEKDGYIVACCSDNKTIPNNIFHKNEFILFFEIINNKVKLLESIKNPLFENPLLKPAIILPKILNEKNTNFFITSKLGVGLRNTLISKGIFPEIKQTINNEILLKLIKNF